MWEAEAVSTVGGTGRFLDLRDAGMKSVGKWPGSMSPQKWRKSFFALLFFKMGKMHFIRTGSSCVLYLVDK